MTLQTLLLLLHFAHLDATTVLSRKIVEQGIYPAVDPLESTSRILEPDVVGEEHYTVARQTQEILQRYKELQDIIGILGMEELDQMKINLQFIEQEKFRNSFLSHSLLVKSLQVSKVSMFH